eukprot:3826096-Pleurochrysis_carterae.AAC.2
MCKTSFASKFCRAGSSSHHIFNGGSTRSNDPLEALESRTHSKETCRVTRHLARELQYGISAAGAAPHLNIVYARSRALVGPFRQEQQAQRYELGTRQQVEKHLSN